MCNLSKGINDRAVVEDIKKLMRNKGWDIEECMDVLDITYGSAAIGFSGDANSSFLLAVTHNVLGKM